VTYGYYTIVLRENEAAGRTSVEDMIYDLHRQIEEPPMYEVSFHGAQEEVICLTWSEEEVDLQAMRATADYFSWRFRDVELYADVSERPKQYQPEMPEQGRLVGIFNEGLKLGILPPEPDPLPLPAPVRRVLARLRESHQIHGQPLVRRLTQEGQEVAEITVRVPKSMYSRYDRDDALYEAIEGTGTPELLVIAKLDFYDPIEHLKRNSNE